jgi:hypothetical protein
LLRVKANPYDPSNRRISILVKNQEGASVLKRAHEVKEMPVPPKVETVKK